MTDNHAPSCTLLVDHVTKRFDDFIAVNELSLKVYPGRIFGLIGPNGAGKTTTLRMIVNITAPDSGQIELLGQKMSAALQDRIGYLPEERGLYKRMKVSDQLRFFGELKSLRGAAATGAIERWLERLKLSEWKNKRAMELSKGMQQKIQFIAAVMHDPDLLVLDEPFSGLDPVSVELLKETVLELKAAGKTIIFSTHMMEMAEKICDDICLMNRSRKILGGSLREVRRSFGHNAVALRIEGGNGVLDDRTLVTRIEERGDELEILLAAGADAQELLRRLLAGGARVSKFELVSPSLNDIFIEKVGGAS
ncbi:MAG TPA: ABC transporter ATP-binding protein [Pyrinomonadaceae bacterium]|jgi:ABC-2 type transport system ATP-binding protein|nr:ABC transporter ATP-binding protein [Pyrinomonadaceae bacterium]